MDFDFDPYEAARDIARVTAQFNGFPAAWGQRGITGPASIAKAARDRYRRDHPQENLPWGYQPTPG
jgi:hypothetical protein